MLAQDGILARMTRRHHRVAVLLLEGAKPLDVGILAQVRRLNLTTDSS
jgi:hypothetical protein